MPRLRSSIAPSTHSATAVVKPALACVTSTPAALAAATSTLRMSIAQRWNTASAGLRANRSALPGVCRSLTITWQPRAASINVSPSSALSLSFSRTSPSARRPARALSP